LILGQHLLPSLLQVLELAFELVEGVFERHGEVTNDIGSIYGQRTADEYILEGSRLTETDNHALRSTNWKIAAVFQSQKRP
jgi:hypothetical protein